MSIYVLCGWNLESVLKRFIVAYNNAFRIMHSLSMRCSTSFMFANARVDSCQARIVECTHSIMCRIQIVLYNA